MKLWKTSISDSPRKELWNYRSKLPKDSFQKRTIKKGAALAQEQEWLGLWDNEITLEC